MFESHFQDEWQRDHTNRAPQRIPTSINMPVARAYSFWWWKICQQARICLSNNYTHRRKKKELKCTKPKKGKQKSQKMEILWIWKRNDKHKTTLMWFWIATLTKATRLMLAHWRSNFRAEGKYHLRKLLYNQTHSLILLAIESAIFYSLAL